MGGVVGKSLAELRATGKVTLPERVYELCLSQALVGEAHSLTEEKAGLEVAAERIREERKASEAAAGGPPARTGEGKHPRLVEIDARIVEIDARLEELYDEMRDHTGKLLLRGISGGEWRRWCDANPGREDGRDERGRPVTLALDDQVTYGFCDASALMARLGDFAVSWNDAPLETGDWDWLQEKAPPGDLKEMARWVVQMHESTGAKALPKSLSGSSTTVKSETA